MENLTLQTLLRDDCEYPRYSTEGSVGLDFPLQEDIYIPPQGVLKVDLGFIVKFPPGLWGMLVPRSSMTKKGIVLANTIGVIDNDYQGPTDTLIAALRNTTDTAVYLSRGDRVVQLILMPVYRPDQITIDHYDEVEEIEGDDRGGFGSTGL